MRLDPSVPPPNSVPALHFPRGAANPGGDRDGHAKPRVRSRGADHAHRQPARGADLQDHPEIAEAQVHRAHRQQVYPCVLIQATATS